MTTPLVAALVLSGCGSSTGPEGALSQLELQSAVFSILNTAVIRVVNDVPGVGGGDPEGGPQAAPVPYEFEEVQTFPCEFGGEVETLTRAERFSFVDDETQNAEIDFLVELDHAACVEGTGSVRITFEGDPGLEASYRFDRQPTGELEILGGIVGTVNVRTSDRSLSCRSNIIVNGSIVNDRIQYAFAGSFCESGVQGTVS
jgi:hypothetical protein